ncbi:MAG TPA: PAS domain-containing sensor histidine kinase [Alphaproteobacteria bacterium]|nr:PAS domain-containing sensor histidine kinase [Alphaproteobacteria bacterium]
MTEGRRKAVAEFEDSFALIDSKGRLVDWNDGLAREWAAIKPMIKRGALYRDLLRAALMNEWSRQFIMANEGHADIERYLDGRLANFGSYQVRDYKYNHIVIRIEERPTRSGGIQRIARNISEERRAREDLAKVQSDLKKTADADSTGVFIEIRRNPDGEYTLPTVSEEMCRLLHLPIELVGADADVIVRRMELTEKSVAATRAKLDEAALKVDIYSNEFIVRDGNDRLRWMRHSLMPHREPDGTVVFAGVMRDVTRAKEAEETLEMLRAVVVRSFDSVTILESEGSVANTKILYVNPKFEQLYGLSAEEVVGGSLRRLETLVQDPESAGAVYLAVAEGRRESADFEVIRPDGRRFWVDTRADLIQQYEDGRFRWVMIGRDVTERHRAVEELVQAKEAAEAANRAKGQFLANMSHELRTPLNAIIGFSELIDSSVRTDGWQDTYIEYLKDISDSGHSLLRLINAVLDLSKIEAGVLILDLQDMDMLDVTQSACKMMAEAAREAGVALDLKVPRTALRLIGDEVKLKQVLLNILSNAIKFTPEGGRATMTLNGTEDTVVVTLVDTGHGIPKDELEQVTLPFVQLDASLSRKHGGTGLGLAIAKQICTLHKGKFEIESTVGTGTTVRITLPRRPI